MQIIDGLYKIYTKIINKLRLFIYNNLMIEDKINELSEAIKKIEESVKKIEESSSSIKHNF